LRMLRIPTWRAKRPTREVVDSLRHSFFKVEHLPTMLDTERRIARIETNL
jgi:hypothetical protein